jgi:2-oxo-4-hydroxy-4-carboxy-5-ureidoimidazoline decarboxylase
MRLQDLNTLPDEAAVDDFLRCCGSTRWARLMTGKRPFASIAQAVNEADRVWASLRAEDWLEAFAAHPRIGDSGMDTRMTLAGTADWSLIEQAGVSSAGPDVRDRLAAANREYEARFGYIFIVCATGKSAEEMLALLERRMTHSPGDELAIAAEEQRKITRLRLGKRLVT